MADIEMPNRLKKRQWVATKPDGQVEVVYTNRELAWLLAVRRCDGDGCWHGSHTSDKRHVLERAIAYNNRFEPGQWEQVICEVHEVPRQWRWPK